MGRDGEGWGEMGRDGEGWRLDEALVGAVGADREDQAERDGEHGERFHLQ